MSSTAVTYSRLGILLVICLTLIISSVVQLFGILLSLIQPTGLGWQIGALITFLVLSSAIFSYLIKGALTGPFFYKEEIIEKITSINLARIGYYFTSGLIDGLRPNHNFKNSKENK